MKESTLATKVMIAILCLGVIAYLAASFIRDWEEPLVITRAYSYTQNVGMEAVGILVRSETVLPDSGGSYVDHILSEGEKASAGQAVALLYNDPSAPAARQINRQAGLAAEKPREGIS